MNIKRRKQCARRAHRTRRQRTPTTQNACHANSAKSAPDRKHCLEPTDRCSVLPLPRHDISPSPLHEHCVQARPPPAATRPATQRRNAAQPPERVFTFRRSKLKSFWHLKHCVAASSAFHTGRTFMNVAASLSSSLTASRGRQEETDRKK